MVHPDPVHRQPFLAEDGVLPHFLDGILGPILPNVRVRAHLGSCGHCLRNHPAARAPLRASSAARLPERLPSGTRVQLSPDSADRERPRAHAGRSVEPVEASSRGQLGGWVRPDGGTRARVCRLLRFLQSRGKSLSLEGGREGVRHARKGARHSETGGSLRQGPHGPRRHGVRVQRRRRPCDLVLFGAAHREPIYCTAISSSPCACSLNRRSYPMRRSSLASPRCKRTIERWRVPRSFAISRRPLSSILSTRQRASVRTCGR